jgi:hypothetical protein
VLILSFSLPEIVVFVERRDDWHLPWQGREQLSGFPLSIYIVVKATALAELYPNFFNFFFVFLSNFD